MKKTVIAIIFILSGIIAGAQTQTLTAKLQNDSIIVGEQTHITITAPITPQAQIIEPEFADTICDKIYLIKNNQAKIENNTYTKQYLITSFDTGLNVINPINFHIISGTDTATLATNILILKVNPYVLIDTIPRDTVFAENSGFILFGKDGFKREIEQYLPDSVKQTMTADTLEMVKTEIKRQLTQQYSSQVMQTGFTNQEQIDSVVNSDSHRLFIVGKDIVETHYVYGSVDSLYVTEAQQINKGDILFTLFQIQDIDDQLYDTPFNMEELWYNIKTFFTKYWWIVLIVTIIAITVYFIIYKKRHGTSPIAMIRVKPRRPAHEIALEELERIRNEKIWSRGQVKEYHVQITETLRNYLNNRFGIDAEQMTTSEILAIIENISAIDHENRNRIRQILELADSVKFAKFQPLQGDNDLSLRNAFDFVETTKEQIAETPGEKTALPEVEAPDTSTNNNA